MYDTGMGPDHVNRFLGDLNIPGIQPSALKKREKEVLPFIQSAARSSCEKALEEEIQLSLAEGR